MSHLEEIHFIVAVLLSSPTARHDTITPMESQPFWEDIYRDCSNFDDPFGAPSPEVVEICRALSPDASVLDLGCGAGRHALYCARRNMRVTAIDISPAALCKLQGIAMSERLSIESVRADLREYVPEAKYDLILTYGVLHLIEPVYRDRIIDLMKLHTKPSGFNVVMVLTDTIPPPSDLEPWFVGLFADGDLLRHYLDWRVLSHQSSILEDYHPPDTRHCHSVNSLVAQLVRGT